MLLRKYKNVVYDQGHVAILFTESKSGKKSVLDEKIIHANSDIENYLISNKLKIKNVGSTRIEKLRISYNCVKGGYYTHVCLPQYWLLME
jgi:hypothetical protein